MLLVLKGGHTIVTSDAAQAAVLKSQGHKNVVVATDQRAWAMQQLEAGYRFHENAATDGSVQLVGDPIDVQDMVETKNYVATLPMAGG